MRSLVAERVENHGVVWTPIGAPLPAAPSDMPPVSESLIVVTGLPRSGTSMLMQMLAAGGVTIVSDELRRADEDNPRGYFEFEPVRSLLKDAKWLFDVKGRGIKIIAPLLVALPPGLPCWAILCERDLDEVLDSQDRMLLRRDQVVAAAAERRRMLKDEYLRTLGRVKTMLARRPRTQVLIAEHRTVISDALATARRINDYLGGGLDVAKMAAAVDPTLHRNRAGVSK